MGRCVGPARGTRLASSHARASSCGMPCTRQIVRATRQIACPLLAWALGPLQRWTKYGAAVGKVVSTLLQHGSGLGLGPDSDGLLNLGDTQPQVGPWGHAAGQPHGGRRLRGQGRRPVRA